MRALNVLPASHYPGTEEVSPIIAMVQGLIDRGHAYAKLTATSAFASARSRATASCRIAISTICYPAPASRSTSEKTTRSTSPSGKPPNRVSRVGSRRGAGGDPAGTSNARQ